MLVHQRVGALKFVDLSIFQYLGNKNATSIGPDLYKFYHPNLPRANQGLSPLPAMLPKARNYPLLSSKLVWLMDFMDFRHGFQPIYFNLRWMEEILHQLIGGLSHYIFIGVQPSKVVQDFFHPQYFNLFQPISTIQTYVFPMDFHHVPPWPTSVASRCARPLGSCGLGWCRQIAGTADI